MKRIVIFIMTTIIVLSNSSSIYSKIDKKNNSSNFDRVVKTKYFNVFYNSSNQTELSQFYNNIDMIAFI